jgi:hypothetical protein
MFEQLTQLIQQSGQQSVIDNPEVPNEHNDAVIAEAQNSILSTLGQLNATGETQQVNDALESADHPVTQNIQQNFAGNIMEKFGINSATATSIAATLIPTVLNAIKGRGAQSGGVNSGGFNIQDILSSLGGTNFGSGGFGSGNIQSSINSIGGKLGLDKDGDGDVDLNDVTKMFR